MAYKISKKSKKVPDKYYTDLEIKELREKYKGRPPISEIMRVGTRNTLQVEKQIHKEGKVVSYEDKLAVVRKVTKKGIYLEKFKTDKNDISYPSGEIVYVTNEQAEHKVYPNFFSNLPLGIIAPYNMGYMED